MQIVNNTIWKTAHLKAILQKAAEIELEPAKRKVLRVTVDYTRGGKSSGCAYIKGRNAWVRIQHPQSRSWRFDYARSLKVPFDDPRPSIGTWHNPDGTSGKLVRNHAPRVMTPEQRSELALAFASVAAHEFAHIRGMRHPQMPAYYKWAGKWREYVAWAKDMPLEVQEKHAVQKDTPDAKLAHVLVMKAKAATRVKRATTILNKWKQRERYYVKAAQKAAQTAKE